jgi:hypothetical protein
MEGQQQTTAGGPTSNNSQQQQQQQQRETGPTEPGPVLVEGMHEGECYKVNLEYWRKSGKKIMFA